MNRFRIYIKNLAANWIGYWVNLTVMFFLSPFIVHRLGPTLYGLWSILISVTSFFCIAELGVRGGLGRYMNYYMGRGRIDKVNEVINTSLAFFALSGGGILFLSLIFVFIFDKIFPYVPKEYIFPSKIALAFLSVHLWLSFFHASFSQILSAADRFELYNFANILVLVIQAVGTFILLSAGKGIIALAFLHIIATLSGVIVSYILVRRAFPLFKLSASYATVRCFREMLGYNLWALAGKLAYRFLYWLDIVLIGMLLGSRPVAYYSIAAMIIFHARNLILQSSYILTPQMVKECARKNWFGLQQMFIRGSNMIMGIGILLFIGFVVFGREFISVWMGSEYQTSYTILFVLSLAHLISLPSMLTSPILGGLNKIYIETSLTLAESALNIGLSVMLVVFTPLGIEGVAWGTFVPRIVVSFLAIIIAGRLIFINKKIFFEQAVGRWVLLGVVFFMVCVALRSLITVDGWLGLLSKVSLAVVIYLPLMWIVLLSKEDRKYAFGLLSSKVAA